MQLPLTQHRTAPIPPPPPSLPPPSSPTRCQMGSTWPCTQLPISLPNRRPRATPIPPLLAPRPCHIAHAGPVSPAAPRRAQLPPSLRGPVGLAVLRGRRAGSRQLLGSCLRIPGPSGSRGVGLGGLTPSGAAGAGLGDVTGLRCDPSTGSFHGWGGQGWQEHPTLPDRGTEGWPRPRCCGWRHRAPCGTPFPAPAHDTGGARPHRDGGSACPWCHHR